MKEEFWEIDHIVFLGTCGSEVTVIGIVPNHVDTSANDNTYPKPQFIIVK